MVPNRELGRKRLTCPVHLLVLFPCVSLSSNLGTSSAHLGERTRTVCVPIIGAEAATPVISMASELQLA